MATFSFPIFRSTGYGLFFVALGACFVGRLHIYIGSWLTNCFRKTDGSTLPPISDIYMFVMWFSGLRGGVAFALASVSYMSMDFPKSCGGLEGAPLEAATAAGKCPADMNDSLAIMQTTMLIAVFTIFVFGGAITEVAVAGGVLEKKKKKAPPKPAGPPSGFAAFSNKYIRPVLTFDNYAPVETGTRFEEAVEKFAGNAFNQEVEPSAWAKARAVQMTSMVKMNAKEIKMSLSADQLETALKGSGYDMREASFEDMLDDLRMKLPVYSGTQLKKLLEEAGGDVELAYMNAPKPGGGALEML